MADTREEMLAVTALKIQNNSAAGNGNIVALKETLDELINWGEDTVVGGGNGGTAVNTEYIVGKIEHNSALVDLYYIRFEVIPGSVNQNFTVPFPTTASAIIRFNQYVAEGGLLGLGAPSSPYWVSISKDPGFVVSSDGTDDGLEFYAEVYYIV